MGDEPRGLAEADGWIRVRKEEWNDLQARLEDAEDALALRDFREANRPREALVPAEVVYRIADGEAMVRAWREYHRWTLAELAERSGLPETTLRAFETDETAPGAEQKSALARAFGCAVELMED